MVVVNQKFCSIFFVCSVKTRQWFSIIFISILHETAVGCTLVISAPVWELIFSSKSLQQSEKGFFCPSSLSPFVLGRLMSQLYRDTPQCLSAFVLNQISHLWQKQGSENQLQLFFFFLLNPPNPSETKILSPFPSCCCWQSSDKHESKWASATRCVPARRAYSGFQVVSRGTRAVLTAVKRVAASCSGLIVNPMLPWERWLIRSNSYEAVAWTTLCIVQMPSSFVCLDLMIVQELE